MAMAKKGGLAIYAPDDPGVNISQLFGGRK
jgi:hypothetical protein